MAHSAIARWQMLETIEKESPPESSEVEAMADYMDVKLDEADHVLEVVRAAVSAPLPPGWEEYLDAGGDTCFRCVRAHPPTPARRGLYKGGGERLSLSLHHLHVSDKRGESSPSRHQRGKEGEEGEPPAKCQVSVSGDPY